MSSRMRNWNKDTLSMLMIIFAFVYKVTKRKKNHSAEKRSGNRTENGITQRREGSKCEVRPGHPNLFCYQLVSFFIFVYVAIKIHRIMICFLMCRIFFIKYKIIYRFLSFTLSLFEIMIFSTI